MKDLKSSVKNNADIAAGKTKTAAGKATDNKELEIKGKIQSTKGKAGKKIDKLTDRK